MNIAIICQPDIPVPPLAGYGGLQRNIYDFIQEIDRRNNHHIFLFASLDSDVGHLRHATLLGNLPQAIWANLVENRGFEDKKELEVTSQAKKAVEQENTYIEYVIQTLSALDVDVIFVAYDNTSLIKRLEPYYGKVVWSIRDSLSPEKKQLLMIHPKLHTTAMSGYVLKENSDILNISTIMWGININNYNFSKYCLSESNETPSLPLLMKWQKQRRDYLVMVAGIGAHKGQATAIEIAKTCKIPLIIAGTPQDHLTLKKTDYFKTRIIPSVSEDIVYFGNANEEQKTELLRFAKASLAPSGFEFPLFKEPFGRSVAESLSCGTPVIGYKYGSLPYLVKDGFTGYLFNTTDEAIRSVMSLDSISREKVRQSAEDSLSIERVVDEYLRLFESLKLS